MSLDEEHWVQLQSLFQLAETAPEQELEAILTFACPDAALRNRAEALIRASKEKFAPVAPQSSAVATIGPYSVLRHLGSGGIGSVYLVERNTAGVVQRAALKVLRRSAAGPLFADRFAREQHILASLDHPNITRLLDAGVSDEGEPYLTMEYVDGVHLDTYCDDRSLGIAERLQLFLRVCEAVAYAHRNLAVHLDLKPSNILVTEAGGIVKLLDFGTSKIIQPDSLLTTTVLATPAYASPEQLRSEPVTTVCDVYALGAGLFELLSGRRPNQDSSVAQMIERSMKELPPESVTAAVTAVAAKHRGLTETRLRNMLTGDLATILVKCITPRPKDRYATVDALITDVQRYLAGMPILARPQTTTYRLSKFVRRNRTAVVTSSIVLCCITALGIYAAIRQRQAFREGQRALQMQTFMSQLFRVANTSYTGKPAATIPELLRLGIRLVPDLIANPGDRRAAQISLAESMFNNDDLKDAQPVFADIIRDARSDGDTGLLAEAESYAGTIAYRQGDTTSGAALSADSLLLSHKPGVTSAVRVTIIVTFVHNRFSRGIRSPEDEKLLRSAVAEGRALKLPDRDQAEAIGFLAEYLSITGGLAEAQVLAKESLSLYARHPYELCDQAEMRALLANIQSFGGDSEGSLQNYRQAYGDLRTCSGDSSLSTLQVQVLMARAMIKAGQAKEAIPILESAVPIWHSAFPGSPDVAGALRFLGNAYVQTSQFEKAEAAAREALEAQAGKVNPNSTRQAMIELLLAQSLQGQRKFADALRHAEIADREYASVPSLSTAERVGASQAQQIMLTLQRKP